MIQIPLHYNYEVQKKDNNRRQVLRKYLLSLVIISLLCMIIIKIITIIKIIKIENVVKKVYQCFKEVQKLFIQNFIICLKKISVNNDGKYNQNNVQDRNLN
jgi:hypothetical protein